MRMALPWNLGEFEFANASMASATIAAFTRTVAVDQAMSAGRGGAEAGAGLAAAAAVEAASVAGSLTAGSVCGASVMACIVVVRPAIDIAIPALGVAVATDSAKRPSAKVPQPTPRRALAPPPPAPRRRPLSPSDPE